MRRWFGKSREGIDGFEEVVEQYYDKVFRLAYRILHSYDEAADITQEVFLHAYRGWREFRGESQVYTWLYRITINLCKNRLKQLKRMRAHEALDVIVGEQPDSEETEDLMRHVELRDKTESPEETIHRQELWEALEKAIMELPLDYRMLITLRDIEGLSYGDIARVLGCTVAAVKAKLFRARTQLREKLRPYLEG